MTANVLLQQFVIILMVGLNTEPLNGAPVQTIDQEFRTPVPNITETWIWLTETPLDKLFYYDEEHWCAHLGSQFEKVSYAKYMLCNNCCKQHFTSISIKINENLTRRCKDEDVFYKCLKEVNSTMSRAIGVHYFNKNPRPMCYEVGLEKCNQMKCGGSLLKLSQKPIRLF